MASCTSAPEPVVRCISRWACEMINRVAYSDECLLQMLASFWCNWLITHRYRPPLHTPANTRLRPIT